MAIKFGIPKREVNKKVEKFPDNPVVTILSWEGKGLNKKFEFNQAALELLGIVPGVTRVNFAFDEESEHAYLAKQAGDDSLVVAKNRSISNKRFYDVIAKMYNLDISHNNYMELVNPVDVAGTKVYQMKSIEPENAVIENTPPPVIEKEIEHMVDGSGSTEGSPEAISMDTARDPEFEPHGDTW